MNPLTKYGASMAGRIENINQEILRQCREQVGLAISEVEKKVARIAAFERGYQKPTYNQLNKLAELYKVPRWVFISDHLPEKYQFQKDVPAFRQFADNSADLFADHKVRALMAKVNRFRKMIIEFHEDMDVPVPLFDPPEIDSKDAPDDVAQRVRKWLNVSKERNDFTGWKVMLEDKGVFVFMTSKYRGWSHVESPAFRGMTVYHSRLPIIIINDSDALKAQSFTLFHELGHLLRKESMIDKWEEYWAATEKWCDDLAGNILMPFHQMRSAVNKMGNIDDLDGIKSIATDFQVSPFACIVRLKRMGIIDEKIYSVLVEKLKAEYRRQKKKLKDSKGGPTRNRAQEVFNQYGKIYTETVFQSYYNKEISFHKLCRLFGLKNPS